MNYAGWGKSSVTGSQKLGLLAYMNHAAALQDNVEFVLSLMRMRRVLLTGFKRVQAGKEKITLRYSALAHLVRCEPGEAGDSFYEHDLQCTIGV